MLSQSRAMILQGGLQSLASLPSSPHSGRFSCLPTPPQLPPLTLPVLCLPSDTVFPVVRCGWSLFSSRPFYKCHHPLSEVSPGHPWQSTLLGSPFPSSPMPLPPSSKISEVHLFVCIVCAFMMCCPSPEHKPWKASVFLCVLSALPAGPGPM